MAVSPTRTTSCGHPGHLTTSTLPLGYAWIQLDLARNDMILVGFYEAFQSDLVLYCERVVRNVERFRGR